MTKSSPARLHTKKARKNVAVTALKVAKHGKTIEANGESYVALPASAYSVVLAALETLAR